MSHSGLCNAVSYIYVFDRKGSLKIELLVVRLAFRVVRSRQEGVIVSRGNGTEGVVD